MTYWAPPSRNYLSLSEQQNTMNVTEYHHVMGEPMLFRYQQNKRGEHPTCMKFTSFQVNNPVEWGNGIPEILQKTLAYSNSM